MPRKNIIEILIKADDKASKKFIALGGNLSKINAKLGSIAKTTAVAGLAVGAALAGVIYKTAQHNDVIAKSAKQIGVTTEFLSEMEHAANISGASQQDIMLGIKRLSKAASDASYGLTTYQRSFDALGVSVTDNEGNLKDSEQLFYEVADALGKLENDTQKAALAQEIFGRGGLRLIPLMNRGAEGIRELREEAKRLGISLDKDAAEGSEELVDSLTRLKASLRGLGIAITTELDEPISNFINKIATETIPKTGDWLNQNKDIISTTVQVGAAVTGASLGFLALNKVIAAFAAHPVAGAAVVSLGLIAATNATMEKSMGDVKEEVSETDRELWGFTSNLGLLNEQLRETESTASSLFDQFISGKITFEEWNAAVQEAQAPSVDVEINEVVRTRKELLEEEEKQIKKIVEVAERRLAIEEERRARAKEKLEGWEVAYPEAPGIEGPPVDIFQPAVKDADVLRANLEAVNLEIDGMAEGLEYVPDLINWAAEEAGRLAEEAGRLRDRFDYSKVDLATDLSSSFGNVLGIMASDAQNKTEAIARMFRNMVSQIISDLARLAAMEFIFAPLFGIPFGGGGEFKALKGLEFVGVGAQRGLEFAGQRPLNLRVPAQSGLEAVGGHYMRDTIPAIISRGEVVAPSPTVSRLNEYLDERDVEGGGNTFVTVHTPFITGSREEMFEFGQYSVRRREAYGKFTVEGTL